MAGVTHETGGPAADATWAILAEEVAAARRTAWQLLPDGPPVLDDDALARPVRTAAGEPAQLRVLRPRPGDGHDHLALRQWNGRGTVRLLRADPAAGVLLVERTRDRDLGSLRGDEACRVLGELVAGLARPPRPPFPALSALAAEWSARLEDGTDLDARFPRRFRLQAATALRRLRRDPLDTALLPGDLVPTAVRAADRAPWLAVRARPRLATVEWALVPGLWPPGDDPRGPRPGELADRAEALALAAGADPDRVRAWAVVRVAVAAAEQAGRPGAEPVRELGRLVRLAKALQSGA